VSTKEVTSRSVIVSWLPSFSGNSAILRYIVQYRQLCSQEKEWKDMSTNNGNDYKLYLHGLYPMCTYEIRVRAENALGKSESSDAIVMTTAEEVPGGPPLDVIVEATSSTSLKIKWKPPLRHLQFGKIKGYYIGYKVNDNYDSETFQYKNVEAINENDGTKYEMSYITNLVRKTSYIVVVQAYNSIGASPRSDEVCIIDICLLLDYYLMIYLIMCYYF
jgi:predicted phage tail protein